MDDAAVPATFHVTVRRPDQVTDVFGDVTRNGPAVSLTVTWTFAAFTPPPPARYRAP